MPDKDSHISIHALLAESDVGRGVSYLSKFGYFYPRSPCGERQRVNGMPELSLYISIHALLAESDDFAFDVGKVAGEFLSTLSLRRATIHCLTIQPTHRHFYPRSPCGERRRDSNVCTKAHFISIHALLAESDLTLSTTKFAFANISIHALLAESDFWGHQDNPFPPDISIHALLAESDEQDLADIPLALQFLSTLSLRRATKMYVPCGWSSAFLSTLSLRRATL